MHRNGRNNFCPVVCLETRGVLKARSWCLSFENGLYTPYLSFLTHSHTHTIHTSLSLVSDWENLSWNRFSAYRRMKRSDTRDGNKPLRWEIERDEMREKARNLAVCERHYTTASSKLDGTMHFSIGGVQICRYTFKHIEVLGDYLGHQYFMTRGRRLVGHTFSVCFCFEEHGIL